MGCARSNHDNIAETKLQLKAQIDKLDESISTMWAAMGQIPVPQEYYDGQQLNQRVLAECPPAYVDVIPRLGPVFWRSGGLAPLEELGNATDDLEFRFGGRWHDTAYRRVFGEPVTIIDPFDPTKELSLYVTMKTRGLIVSSGPDRVRQFSIEDACRAQADSEVINLVYDPTNGVVSSGDLFSSLGFVEKFDQDNLQ